jgi:hypothetical protein
LSNFGFSLHLSPSIEMNALRPLALSPAPLPLVGEGFAPLARVPESAE